MGIESRPGPELPSATAERPAQRAVGSRLRWIKRAAWAAALAAVIAPAAYERYTGARQQASGEVADGVRDFETLPDGEVLLDLGQEGFVSRPIRLPGVEPGQPGPVVTFMAPANGEKHKGPLIRVNDATYSIVDPDPLDKSKRVSLHLSRVIRHDARTIRIESDTKLFRGTQALIGVRDISRECDSVDKGSSLVCVDCSTQGKIALSNKTVTLRLEPEQPRAYAAAPAASISELVRHAESPLPARP